MARLVSFNDAALGYGNTPALTGLTLDVFGGQALALVGPNGGGKTTLMRGIVGGCSILSGSVRVDAERIGLVPQSADLDLTFPVNASEVVTMGLISEAGWGRRISADMRARVADALERVNLTEKASHRFGTLSGGQRQRVAIVRALMMDPEILLLDEVTASLDPEMVREVLDVVLELARTGMTMLIVTHEMGFARAIADRIVFMDEGRIVEVDPPRKFFADPSSDRARRFLDIFSFEGAKL